MNKKILFELGSLYRDCMRVTGYVFGEGEKSACIVGSTRGNEVQQLFCCSLLVHYLKELEGLGAIAPGKSIMVLPCINPSSMNIEKRFWSTDNTDINRMFPGYHLGETTQRIAAGVFDEISSYKYGMQFVSSYIPGKYIPHVCMMRTGLENVKLAAEFGLDYVVIREPRPYDTTTLNYNWQIWNCQAVSIYIDATSHIQEESASQAVNAILRFLFKEGILLKTGAQHMAKLEDEAEREVTPDIILESDAASVRACAAGFLRVIKDIRSEVKKGDVLACIVDPFEGDIKYEILAPKSGIVFYSCQKPLVNANTVVFKILSNA